jgi:tetratricopeptide (TPR) repeat protein
MAIEGALQDVGLADICQLLGMGRKTGCLSITDRSNFGYIYFRNGRVIHASVLNRPDRLGEMLVRKGIISREELRAAVAEQAVQRRKRIGEILLERKSLEPDQLQEHVRRQIEEAVYHLFTWVQGSFHFDSGQAPEEDGLFLVDIPPESLLMEGARRVDEWTQVEKKIPSFDIVFQVDKDPDTAGDDVELTEAQRKVLPLIDGLRTVTEIVQESGLGDFDTGKALYGLVQGSFISRAGEYRVVPEPGADEELQERLNLGIAFYRSGMMEDATRELSEVLNLDGGQARAHFTLGLIALRSGRPEEALGRFDAMPAEVRAKPTVQRNRALAFVLSGRHEEALSALDAARTTGEPEDSDDRLLAAMTHLELRDAARALEELRAYRTSPKLKKPAPAYYAYATLASAIAGDLEYAVAVGREGLGHYPESGPILVNTGTVLERLGEMSAAEALYKRAVAVTPTPAQAHKSLGDQAWARGDHEAARIQYEKAVKIAPRLGDDVFLRLGTLAYKDNDRDVARLLWQRAIELDPDNEAVRANLESLEAG